MGRIDDLIKEYCAADLEYHELGNLASADAAKDGELPHEVAEKAIDSIPTIVVQSCGSISFEYHDKLLSQKKSLWSYRVLNSNINLKFIYHYLLSQREKLQSLSTGKGEEITQLAKSDTDSLEIPIPPLEIQEEIVAALDKFIEQETKREEELETKLEERLKEYTYYRDELLSFDETKTSHFPLGEIFTLKSGYKPDEAAPLAAETIAWFSMADIHSNGKILSNSLKLISEVAAEGRSLFPANSILISTSAIIGEHALITIPHLASQRFTSLVPKPRFSKRLNMKFVFYYCFTLCDWCLQHTEISGFASRTVKMAEFKKFKFPVPPLAVQEEIVAILDKFDALVNEISIGLPGELEALKQQYEYYRDELLDFKKDE